MHAMVFHGVPAGFRRGLEGFSGSQVRFSGFSETLFHSVLWRFWTLQSISAGFSGALGDFAGSQIGSTTVLGGFKGGSKRSKTFQYVSEVLEEFHRK